MLKAIIAALTVIVAALTAGTAAARAQCEPAPPVRQILFRHAEAWRTAHVRADREAAVAILTAGLAQQPDDAFLLQGRMDTLEREADPGARLHWAAAQHALHADRPVYALLHGEALVGRDTPAAQSMLDTLAAAHPELPQAWLALAAATSTGKQKDLPRAQRAIAAFLEHCPAPLTTAALQTIARSGSAEQRLAAASAVRAHLGAPGDPAMAAVWTALWSLEFKAHSTAEHADLRRQLARDLQAMQRLPHADDLAWLEVRRTGYEYVADSAGAARMTAAILRLHPASDAAIRLTMESWKKEHPILPAPGQDVHMHMRAYVRDRTAAVEAWHRQWPGDPAVLTEWIDTLRADTPAERITSAADAVLAMARKEPDWYDEWSGLEPAELGVAGLLAGHRLRLDEVPALAERSYLAVLGRLEWQLADDRFDDKATTGMRGAVVMLKLEHARVMLDYLAAVGQPAKAAAIDADLAPLAPEKPYEKIEILDMRGRAAEMQGHKLDALLFYRGALAAKEAASSSRTADADSPRARQIDRLWRELGGTTAARDLLQPAPSISGPPGSIAAAATTAPGSAAADARWERPARPLPDFALADLGGTTWKLVELRGKAVLINVWATWCGPCRAEHPAFQKLYDTLKGRTDVAVLSFSVDDEVAMIASYMSEHHYTFPVVPARDVVDAVVPSLSIPRNWYVDPQGRLQWEQLGYHAGADWQQTALTRLEELLHPAS